MPYVRKRDGATVPRSEAIADDRVRDGYVATLEDGDHVSFSVGLMDSATRVTDATRFLFDAAGKPRRLIDADTGLPAGVTLNTDLIAAMQAEADRLGLGLRRYLADVLRYRTAEANLTSEEGAA